MAHDIFPLVARIPTPIVNQAEAAVAVRSTSLSFGETIGVGRAGGR